MPKIDDVIGDQFVVKFIEFEYDKNGELIEKKSMIQNAIDFVGDEGSVDPLGASDAELVQLTIAAGQVLEIYSLDFSSEAGAKGVGVGYATTTTFADPFSGMAGAVQMWAGQIPTTLSLSKTGTIAPLIVIDNSDGSVPLYFFLYALDAYLGVVQVNGEEIGGSFSGKLYTP